MRSDTYQGHTLKITGSNPVPAVNRRRSGTPALGAFLQLGQQLDLDQAGVPIGRPGRQSPVLPSPNDVFSNPLTEASRDGQLSRADWPSEQISLHQVATVRPQSGELIVRLHTFGGHP